MRNITLALILLLTATGAAFAQTDAKADAIIKQARAAIGKEDKFKAMQTLSAEGTVRQTMGDRQNESTLELEIMGNEKVKTTLTSQFLTLIRAFDGTNFWNDFIPGMGMGGGPGGGGMRVMMGGGPGGPGGGAPSAMQAYQQQQQKRDIGQLLMGLFLSPPASFNTTYAFVGEAPGPNDTKLNVVDAKWADGLVTRLYFSQADNRLIGLSYKAKTMRFGRGPGGQGGGGQRPAADGGQRQGGGNAQGGQGGQRPQLTPEEMEKMRKEREEAFNKQPESDFRWAFDDYRSVNGLNLPHRITKSENGTPNEEWEISKYKANNNKITADKFVKKERTPPPAQ